MNMEVKMVIAGGMGCSDVKVMMLWGIAPKEYTMVWPSVRDNTCMMKTATLSAMMMSVTKGADPVGLSSL